MKVFFFGVIDPRQKGHFLYDREKRRVEHGGRSELPFPVVTLDAGLLPPNQSQEQGKWHLAIINMWTVIGCWDRTGDGRGGSNASFICNEIHTREEMAQIAGLVFPDLWERITASK